MERLKGLKCRECGRYYPSSPIHVCEFCFGPLEVDYDYEVIASQISRAKIEAGPPSIWRYAPLLPSARRWASLRCCGRGTWPRSWASRSCG